MKELPRRTEGVEGPRRCLPCHADPRKAYAASRWVRHPSRRTSVQRMVEERRFSAAKKTIKRISSILPNGSRAATAERGEKTCRGTGRLSPALCENQRRKGTGAPDCVARDIKIKSKARPPARATPSVESLRLLIAGFPITRSPDDPRIPPFASQRNGAPVCLVRERKSGQSLGHPASLDTRRSS